MQLSRNFKSEEFACPCCKKDDININLVFLLQNLRDILKRPIVITEGGGFRCPAYNKQIGGAEKSFHMQGLAADIYCPDLEISQIYIIVSTMYGHLFRGIGIDKQRNFLHLDLGNRFNRWIYIDKKPVMFF